MTEVKAAITILAKKSQETKISQEALHYSQAALNLAHVALSLHSLMNHPYQGAAQNAQTNLQQ